MAWTSEGEERNNRKAISSVLSPHSPQCTRTPPSLTHLGTDHLMQAMITQAVALLILRVTTEMQTRMSFYLVYSEGNQRSFGGLPTCRFPPPQFYFLIAPPTIKYCIPRRHFYRTGVLLRRSIIDPATRRCITTHCSYGRWPFLYISRPWVDPHLVDGAQGPQTRLTPRPSMWICGC